MSIIEGDVPRGNSNTGNPAPLPPPSKVSRAVSAAALAASSPCASLVASIGEDFLGLVDFGVAQFFEPRDFVQRQIGEQFQEAPDIGIFGVAPELPVIIGRERSGFSHTAPAAVLPILAPDEVVISGVVRPNRFGIRHAPPKLDAIDDIAPLIRAAHLQRAAMALVQARRNHSPARSCS